ncbi:hypothetical protein JOQ06_020545, partial [Pogonophryne albipinna]
GEIGQRASLGKENTHPLEQKMNRATDFPGLEITETQHPRPPVGLFLRISPKQVGKIKSGEYANLIGLAGLCDLVSALQLEQTPRRESEIAVQIPR